MYTTHGWNAELLYHFLKGFDHKKINAIISDFYDNTCTHLLWKPTEVQVDITQFKKKPHDLINNKDENITSISPKSIGNIRILGIYEFSHKFLMSFKK